MVFPSRHTTSINQYNQYAYFLIHFPQASTIVLFHVTAKEWVMICLTSSLTADFGQGKKNLGPHQHHSAPSSYVKIDLFVIVPSFKSLEPSAHPPFDNLAFCIDLGVS